MTEQMTPEETLVEAYHVLFDAKDELGSHRRTVDGLETENRRYALYGALNALERAMNDMGIETPSRFDGDGRTAENGGLK